MTKLGWEIEPVHVVPGKDGAGVLVVCEHAANDIPSALGDLGLPAELRDSHIAWDPGALGVAKALAGQLGAPLVHGGISRLVYDCNRPPQARDAVPEKSETFDIPGNRELTEAARQDRVDRVYTPFRTRLAAQIADQRPHCLITIHSFTPVFRGVARQVEIGLLHGRDDRIARAMMDTAPLGHDIRLNEPYSAADGVAHTLDLHGAENGIPSVMIEIRNDLLTGPASEAAMAEMLGKWFARVEEVTA
ncbi:N-formylglutamate amidohydrolase [Aliishimia ponticola]|uniref:N-formylglutamate amidohydrolase n=1 Tax=Aliishimia ponticola TaxID=2499833 RepID=A0A4S4NHG6_9RHOB|nr:N-formylglutamate amidohydrolase [Aliishimia ponticola]THH39089.1 N-formylglutamate amidohydrolase [Aliishimia ponticola]